MRRVQRTWPTLAIVESISTYYDSVFLPFEDMWFVYPVDADTTFTFICTTLGCMEPVACNFDPAATLSDGSCEFLSCLGFGCTLEGACNFDEDALVNDGSCEFESCQGCQTEGACNYDATATLVGPCDFDWCAGCMDPNAFNYDEDATIPAFNLQSDGTAEDACIYAGCTFYWACNYDPTGIVNDGSCDMESCAGCQIEEACNYDPAATLSGDCTFAAEGYDCDGNCLVDSNNDGICDGIEDGNGGCTDPSNPGYDPNAAYDDGSCFEGGCLVEFACNYDLMADFMDLSTCDFNSCVGCTDAMACNYDPTATLSSPGSCTFPWNQSMIATANATTTPTATGFAMNLKSPVAWKTRPSTTTPTPQRTTAAAWSLQEVVWSLLLATTTPQPTITTVVVTLGALILYP